MTMEEKQLLHKDICARLPYGVKIATSRYQYGDTSTPTGIVGDKCYFGDNPRYDGDCPIEDIKPYLRPMSSMTEEEEKELSYIAGLHRSKYGFVNHIDGYPGNSIFTEVVVARAADFFNAHHFDYRGLIEKGLALEAPEGMYKTE